MVLGDVVPEEHRILPSRSDSSHQGSPRAKTKEGRGRRREGHKECRLRSTTSPLGTAAGPAPSVMGVMKLGTEKRGTLIPPSPDPHTHDRSAVPCTLGEHRFDQPWDDLHSPVTPEPSISFFGNRFSMLTVNSESHDRHREPTSDNFWGAVFQGDVTHTFTPRGWRSEVGLFSKRSDSAIRLSRVFNYPTWTGCVTLCTLRKSDQPSCLRFQEF